MVFSLFSGRSKVVNIVMNDHSIRYAELKQKNPVTPLHYGERILPSGIIVDGKIRDFETLASILEECIEEWKIARRELRFTVPDSLVIIRKVSIPADVQEDEIHGFLYLELGSTIHLPFDDPVFDTVVLGNNQNKQEILVFATPEKYVTEYVDLFKSVKLKPLAADISPLAVYRLYHQKGEPHTDEVLMSIQFDLESVSMCIFEEQTPVFMRHIAVDPNTNWKLKRSGDVQEMVYEGELNELNLQFEEMYREISKLTDFYRYSLTEGKKEVTKLLLNGDHPMLFRVLHAMGERFGIPVETLKIQLQQEASEELPVAFYPVMGLGLKEVK